MKLMVILAALAIGQAAAAQQPPSETLAFRYQRAELATPEGRARLQQRLTRQVARFCAARIPVRQQALQAHCRDDLAQQIAERLAARHLAAAEGGRKTGH
ncbi:MAG: UrcA family protein [Rhodothalassiaceae bacterium]